jgi:hypothetical protein
MTPDIVPVGLRAEFDMDELLWELELLVSDWVDDEFTAIMIASGFGDRIIVGTEPRPLVAERPKTPVRRRPYRESDRRDRWSRVRSPPPREENVSAGHPAGGCPAARI